LPASERISAATASVDIAVDRIPRTGPRRWDLFGPGPNGDLFNRPAGRSSPVAASSKSSFRARC